MKVFQILVWMLFFLVIAVAPTLAHCGKDHSKSLQVIAQMTTEELGQYLAEANISAETLLLERLLRAKDEERAKKKNKEKEENQKSLDELINKLRIDR